MHGYLYIGHVESSVKYIIIIIIIIMLPLAITVIVVNIRIMILHKLKAQSAPIQLLPPM